MSADESRQLTELEKAYLTIAHFQLQYSRLQSAAKYLVATERPAFSKHQTAVLKDRLRELNDIANESTPQWPIKS